MGVVRAVRDCVVRVYRVVMCPPHFSTFSTDLTVRSNGVLYHCYGHLTTTTWTCNVTPRTVCLVWDTQ